MGTLTPFLCEDLIVFTLYPSPLIVKKNPVLWLKNGITRRIILAGLESSCYCHSAFQICRLHFTEMSFRKPLKEYRQKRGECAYVYIYNIYIYTYTSGRA